MTIEGLPALCNVFIGVLAALQPTLYCKLVQTVHPDAELSLIQRARAILVRIFERLIKLLLELLANLVATFVSWLAQRILKLLLFLLLFLSHLLVPLVNVFDQPRKVLLLALEFLRRQ